MSGKQQTYWITHSNGGAKALVEGAAERDRWKNLHGWEDTTEPVSGDKVWVHNATTDGRTVLPFDVVRRGSYWHGVGFVASAPAEPVDLTRDPVLRDQPATATNSASASKAGDVATTAADSGNPKEK